ncbi:hypothetical protein Tco_1333165, partial [Tanacetum coccineum]
MSQVVLSQSTVSVFYQNTARPKVSKAVLSQSTARPYFPRQVFHTSTGRPYYLRMDNVNLEEELKDHTIIDSGCSGSMIGDKDKLSDFKDLTWLDKIKKVSDGSTGLNEVDVNSGDSQMMDVNDTITTEVNKGTAQVHEGTTQVNEGTAEVNESTVGENLSTDPLMEKMEDEAGPSTFQDESDEFIQDDILIADTLVNI